MSEPLEEDNVRPIFFVLFVPSSRRPTGARRLWRFLLVSERKCTLIEDPGKGKERRTWSRLFPLAPAHRIHIGRVHLHCSRLACAQRRFANRGATFFSLFFSFFFFFFFSFSSLSVPFETPMLSVDCHSLTSLAAFKWHSVTLYCPENLMFIDKIDQSWRGLFLRRHEPYETVGLARSIWDTFFSEEAQWEVSLSTLEHGRLKKIIKQANPDVGLEQNIFDRAYDLVVRDMSRSLANFQTSPFWAEYRKHRVRFFPIFLFSHVFPLIIHAVRMSSSRSFRLQIELSDALGPGLLPWTAPRFQRTPVRLRRRLDLAALGRRAWTAGKEKIVANRKVLSKFVSCSFAAKTVRPTV